MDQGQGSQNNYWLQQTCSLHQGNSEVPIDYTGDTREPLMDNLLDRSGLFDELVCQILDESQPNIEAEVSNTLSGQQNQPEDAAILQDNFRGLCVRTSTDGVPLPWTKSNAEMSHGSPRHPVFPPGITERPTHPATFDVHQGTNTNNGQECPTPVTRVDEQSVGRVKQLASGMKNMPEFIQPSHFMKGDHIEVPHFQENFPGRSIQGNAPSSGGDCGVVPMPPPEGRYGQPTLVGFSQRSRALGFRGGQEGRRGSPVPDDPHQYFRQRASAAQKARAREQFLRQNRAALPFPSNTEQQAINLGSAQNLDIKNQLMQMNTANSWESFNKLVTKGNMNLRTNSMAFDQTQYVGNMNNANASYDQNRPPNYQFSLHGMPQQQGTFPASNMNQGQKTSGPSGQFIQQPFSARSQTDFHNRLANQTMTTWQPSQQCPQNDNQTYLDQLHVQLESCYYQFYSIEKERKKTETELSRLNPGKRISSANTIQNPQLPDNPTSVDRMIVDFYKEHSRVYTLMSKIGGLCAEALHPNIDGCLDNWVEAIQDAGKKRKDELRRLQNGSADRSEQRGYVLIDVIQKLAKATRSIRTALWCALQMSKDSDGRQSIME